MAKADKTVCESCGAYVTGDRCDLCGTPVSHTAIPEPDDTIEATVPIEDSGSHDEEVSAPVAAATTASGKVVCPTCGAANRAGARFCDQCGEGFSVAEEAAGPAVTAPAPPPKKKSPKLDHARNGNPKEPQPRVGRYVAIAVVAVIVLYLISVNSSSTEQPARPAPVAGQASGSSGGDLDAYLPEDADLAVSLQASKSAIEAEADASRRQALREELITTYVSSGRLDLAGKEQEQLAEETGSAEAWAHAGNLHFDWMEGQSGPERVKAAQRAARAYEKALETDPDNLDVRTDLGVAYLNDPSSPMLAIQNTNMVLAADSNHVQANFNKAVMLAQIGRTDEAIRLFKKVTELSSPGEPAHDRALQVLMQLGAPAGSADDTSG